MKIEFKVSSQCSFICLEFRNQTFLFCTFLKCLKGDCKHHILKIWKQRIYVIKYSLIFLSFSISFFLYFLSRQVHSFSLFQKPTERNWVYFSHCSSLWFSSLNVFPSWEIIFGISKPAATKSETTDKNFIKIFYSISFVDFSRKVLFYHADFYFKAFLWTSL